MAFPILPAKYYLTHFFELIDFLESHYQSLFEQPHSHFINDFRNLSEDAQCAYVRMINRKGEVFSIRAFEKYTEINNPSQSIAELKNNHFVSRVTEQNKSCLLEFLTKTDLRKWLNESRVMVSTSLSKEDLICIAKENLEKLEIKSLVEVSDLVVQSRSNELEYLLFLYFGKIQKTLNLYALRDLGIRKTNEKTDFRPRYESLEQAKAEYFFSQEISGETNIELLLEQCLDYKNLRNSSRKLRDHLLLEIANRIDSDRIDLMIKALEGCRSHPAREKRARLYYRLDHKEKAKSLLEEIIAEPWSDEELLFAEDFMARKFAKKKLGYLTEVLKNSREITLSDYYFRQPENGVKDLYRKQGFTVHFTENHLWNGLFGLLFWDELFESEKAAIFNPFERSPVDLVDVEFYERHKNNIENKLGNLKNLKLTELSILKTVSERYGTPNDVFQWHPNLVKITLDFIKSSAKQEVAHVLRTMAKRFEHYHSGYPDLMVIKNDIARFIEVKAEGDALRSKQLSKIRLLNEAGFEVEVLRVKWETDPNQVYVVVDVETTGGSSKFHRVTEIGAVKIQGGKIIDEFQTLLNPGRPIPKYITQITGITDEMVAEAPTFSEIANEFLEFTEGAIFVAHNVRFDYGFIQREFQKLDIPFVRPQMCTVSGMRKTFPGITSYSLKNLTEHFGISLDQHHRAMCDAKAAAQLLLMMNESRL